MIRTVVEKEILVRKDDVEMITGMMFEFNAEVVDKYYSKVNKDVVKMYIIIESEDFTELSEWFDKNYDGMISILK